MALTVNSQDASSLWFQFSFKELFNLTLWWLTGRIASRQWISNRLSPRNRRDLSHYLFIFPLSKWVKEILPNRQKVVNPSQIYALLAENHFIAFWNIFISTLYKGYICNNFPSSLPFILLSFFCFSLSSPTQVHISALLIPSELLCF